MWYKKDAGDVWLEGFSDDADMLGLALCEGGICIEGILVRRSSEGVEVLGGNPYCCCCGVCPGGVGIGGASDVGLGSIVYARPLGGKKGDCCAS